MNSDDDIEHKKDRESDSSDESRAGSNLANHDSDFSLSSLSDTFFYDHFPSRSSRMGGSEYNKYNKKIKNTHNIRCKEVVNNYDDDDGDGDDDNDDVECSKLSFKLLKLNEKEWDDDK